METATTPQPQTLDEIGLAGTNADGSLDALERDLKEARGAFWRRSAMNYDPTSAAGMALVDVELPALSEVEQATLAELDGLDQTLGEHVAQLQGLGFRADLSPSDHVAMMASIPLVREELVGLPPADLAQVIRTAIAFGDRARLAGYATLGASLIGQRSDISGTVRWELEAALQDCRRLTADARAIAVEQKLQRVRNRLRTTRSDLVSRANAHTPGQLGNTLERATFGVKAPDRYVTDALMVRAGLADLD
jgi:hypothetical protein